MYHAMKCAYEIARKAFVGKRAREESDRARALVSATPSDVRRLVTLPEPRGRRESLVHFGGGDPFADVEMFRSDQGWIAGSDEFPGAHRHRRRSRGAV